MPEAFIRQIAYSAQTRDSRPLGFSVLDNVKNERPDWREYWPIRRFLRDSPMREEAFYAFFSPKFGTKTGLDAKRVIDFIDRHGDDSDVLLFSPFFDQIAYPLNIFEQGAMQHRETLRTFRETVGLVAPAVDFDTLLMDSTNTVFCNFFAAKPAFWRAWLEKCERIFSIAESGKTDFALRLNANADHEGGGAPTKTFVIERIASLMLTTESRWKAKAFNSQDLPWSGSPLGQFRLEMTFLDALKVAYAREGHPQYLAAFHDLRAWVGESLRKAQS
jgi:hypothetical protein